MAIGAGLIGVALIKPDWFLCNKISLIFSLLFLLACNTIIATSSNSKIQMLIFFFINRGSKFGYRFQQAANYRKI